MTASEFVKLNPQTVRNSANLMQGYIELFSETFGRKPDCAGCTFKRDFGRLLKKLQTGAEPTTLKSMSTPTFKLKKGYADKILSYKKDNRMHRTYGRTADEAFVKAFLKHGTKEEIAERKAIFEVLPGKAEPAKEPAKEPGTESLD